jgi:peptidoglycan/LPS O-acetylase OafA/YrhL
LETPGTYRREIDGLRALALLPVMVFHANPAWLSGGFVGVDVFFVISGYLITTLIVRDLERGSFSLATFYERRVRRIAPALLAVLIATTAFGWFWLLPKDFEAYLRSLVASLLFVSNVLFWKESGYFDGESELKPLLHTWSLSIEEQFYLLFPLFLLVAWRMGRRWLTGALVLIAFLSLVMAERRAIVNPVYTYYLLPTRGWELLIGSLIALLLSKPYLSFLSPNARIREALGVLGLGMIAFSAVAFSSTTPFPSTFALVPTLGAALVIVFAKPQTWVGRVLGLRLLVGLGLISYSAYLWHFPVFALARQRSLKALEAPELIALGLLALFLAWCSWRFIETPFRRPGAVTRRGVLTLSASVGGMLLVVGLLGIQQQGFASRAIVAHLPPLYLTQTWIDWGSYRGTDGAPCISQDRASLCEITGRESQPKFLLVGDSHSADLNAPWRRFLGETGASGWQLSVAACGFRPDEQANDSGPSECARARELIEVKVRETRFDAVVVVNHLHGYFSHTVEFERTFPAYEAFLKTLAASGARVIVLTPRPELNVSPTRAAILGRLGEVRVGTPTTAGELDQRLRALEASGVIELFDQSGVLLSLGCGASSCFNGHTLDLTPIYRDEGHLTDYGAEQVFSKLAKMLRAP